MCICYVHTVLFIENRPDGSQSVKQSVNGQSFSRSFSQSYGQSVSGVTRHNYAVLKFNVERKRWRTRRGSTSFDHHCPRWRNELGWSSKGTTCCQLIRKANLENRLLVTLDQSPYGRSVSRSVSRSTPVNCPVFYETYRIMYFLSSCFLGLYHNTCICNH